MAIIETLHSQFVPNNIGSAGAITARSSFTVNVAVPEVQVDQIAIPFNFTMCSYLGRYMFQPDDNIIILSSWFCLPYHFIFSRPAATFAWVRGDNAAVGPITQISFPDGNMAFPVANSEVSYGVYVPYGGVGPASYMSIGGLCLDAWISMIGCPAALDTQIFYPTVCCKVMHNLQMW